MEVKGASLVVGKAMLFPRLSTMMVTGDCAGWGVAGPMVDSLCEALGLSLSGCDRECVLCGALGLLEERVYLGWFCRGKVKRSLMRRGRTIANMARAHSAIKLARLAAPPTF